METNNKEKYEAGEAILWDAESEESKVEYCINLQTVLKPIYSYNFVILAIKQSHDISTRQTPDVIAVCKGKEILAETFIKLSTSDYFCKAHYLTDKVIQALKEEEEE